MHTQLPNVTKDVSLHLCLYLCICNVPKTSEYDQEMPQLQITDQTMAP